MRNRVFVVGALLLIALIAAYLSVGNRILGILVGIGNRSNVSTINIADVTPMAVNAPMTVMPADETTANVVAAADALLATLDDTLRAKLLFAFDDKAQRANWSNLPSGLYQRAGLRMGDLSPVQRAAVYAVMAATLSPEGYQRVLDTTMGDEVLKETADNWIVEFGQDEYYFSILGTPSTSEPWIWQFGGHHLAINATIVSGTIVLTPSLTGGEPIQYDVDGRHVHQWQEENDRAFALINALHADQQKQAILGSSFASLALGPGQDDKIIQPQGIKVANLSADQQKLVLDLIAVRVTMLRADDAALKMAEVQANLAETWFAWYGPTSNGAVAYYRIQGPTIFLEYAPQATGGAVIDHVHAMFRDPTNDYGARYR